MLKKTLFITVLFFLSGFPAAAQIAEDGNFTMSLPTINWALQIDLKGFQLQGMELLPDGENQKMQAFNKDTEIVISAFLEKADHAGDANECREFYWSKGKKSPIKKKDIKLKELNGVPVVEYTAVEYEGKKFIQKNINAYYSKNGYWVDIHMSKMVKNTEQEPAFGQVLASVKFVENYEPTRSCCFRYGSVYYLAGNYPGAIKWYQKLYDMEKNERQLDLAFWRVAVDNLGMSYGMSGDIKRSREIYLAALEKDPEYCAFYYNLACGYAEEGDYEKAMLNLEKAVKFQDNLVLGDNFPDPSTDTSFTKYKDDKRFKDILKQIKKKK